MSRSPFRTISVWLVMLTAVALTGCPPRPLFDVYQIPGISVTDRSGRGSVSVLLRPEGNELSVSHVGRFDSVAVVRRDAGEVLPLGTIHLTEDTDVVKAAITNAVFRDTLASRLSSRYEVYALSSEGERWRLPVEYATTEQEYAERLGGR